MTATPPDSVGSARMLRVVALLLALTTALTVAFWVSFFADYAAQDSSCFARRSSAWLLWEQSFPAADLWMAAACLLGAVGLWRGRSWGLLFTLSGSGALIFLGLMDALFFLQNGLYWPVNADVLVEAGIHLWALAFGPFTMAYTWRHRRELDHD